MEAIPRLPMLSFDLKVSDDHEEFSSKLKKYIAEAYDEDPEMFSGEINQLEGLRASAVRPAKDVTGCSTLKKYFCQLHFLLSRFPMGKDGKAAIRFSWNDVYANMVCSLSDINFEMVSILYNIGALHSQLGAEDSRTSADGMKMSCTHFQCAAWAFQHLREEFPQSMGLDVAPDMMSFLNQVCLAQAQECILEKSMMDNRKATIISKVAVQTVDYYKQALKLLTSCTDENSFGETIGSKLYKKWEKYLKFKSTYHGSIVLLFQGHQVEEQQKMGERVAYYQAAFDKLEEAKKLAKGMDHKEAVTEALTFLNDVVEGKRKAAKNENEFIYHEEVPSTALLAEAKGASLVKGIPFNVNDPDVSGPDIFARIIPMKAHESSSLYSEEKAKLMRRVDQLVAAKDESLDGLLATLELDDLYINMESRKLPQQLVDRCAALSAKPDAIQDLVEAMNRLSDTYHDVEAMLKDIQDLLREEDANERDYQQVVGKRPPSIAATDLTREARKYQEAHAKASDSNATLHKAMVLHIANLRTLMLPLPELEAHIPEIVLESAEDEAVVAEMRHLMGKVDEMRRQRAMLVQQLRDGLRQDDITRQVVTYTGDSLQPLFEKELHKHHRTMHIIDHNVAAQANILAAVKDTYARYAGTRRSTAEMFRRRQATIASLVASYDAYEDLILKSSKGLDFYRKLENNVSKLLTRVKGTCRVQQEEREQILANNTKLAKESFAAEAPQGGLKLKDYLNMKKETGTLSLGYGSTYYAAQAPSPTPTTQPWVPGVRPAPVGSEETEPLATTDTAPVVPAAPSALEDKPYYPYSGYYPTTQTYPVYTPPAKYEPPAPPQAHYPPAVSPVPATPTPYTAPYPQYQPPANPAYPTQHPAHVNPSTQSSYQTYGYEYQNYQQPNPVATQPALYQSYQQPYQNGYSDQAYQSPAVYQPVSSQPEYPYQGYPASVEPAGTVGTVGAAGGAVAVPPWSQTYTQTYDATSFTQDPSYQPSQQYFQTGNSSLYTACEKVDYTSTSSANQANVTSPGSEYYFVGQYGAQTSQAGYPQPAADHQATYMQAGPEHQAVTTTTYSNKTSPTAQEGSNLDLLAGLDFNVEQSPLVPEAVARPEPEAPVPVKQEAVEPERRAESPPPTPAAPAIPPTPVTPVKVSPLRDALADPETINQFVAEVDKFEKFVEGLSLKTLNGPTCLDVKWKELQELQDKESQLHSISVSRCYPMKNRFPDILPYDDNRVELPSTKDDYINASRLKGLCLGIPELILTQAPLPSTYGDFWAMVMQHQVEVVVCLLSDAELGGQVYWPRDRAAELEAGRLRVALQSCTARQHWVERVLSVTAVDTRLARVVLHLQFTAWPGSSFPASPAAFLSFVTESTGFLQQQRSPGHPAVVHCLAGVGRTGLYCLVLSALRDTAARAALPDMVATAARVSRARKGSLRDREHLKFAYHAVLYHCQDLLLKRGILSSRSSFEDKKHKEGSSRGHTRHPSQDFLLTDGSQQGQQTQQTQQAQAGIEALTIDASGKPTVRSQSACSRRSSAASSGRSSPISLPPMPPGAPLDALTSVDAASLSLHAQAATARLANKKRYAPENFAQPAGLETFDKDSSDPLSRLDPLWTIKK